MEELSACGVQVVFLNHAIVAASFMAPSGAVPEPARQAISY